MRIEDNVLIVDEEILEDKLDEFEVTINQPQIEKIVIQTDDIDARGIQLLWCLDKEVEVESEFLAKFFENVKVVN